LLLTTTLDIVILAFKETKQSTHLYSPIIKITFILLTLTKRPLHKYECQVGEKWRFDDYSYLCKGLFVRVSKIKVIFIIGE
jgi:hypothetical protein